MRKQRVRSGDIAGIERQPRGRPGDAVRVPPAAGVRRRGVLVLPAAMLAGCTTLLGAGDPLQVHLVALEPLPGVGLELRFLCRLRVQNPNPHPVAYDGIAVELEARGSTLASGVSSAAGNVPRFGEALVGIPVSASTFRLAQQAIALFTASERGPIDYVLRGKLGVSDWGAIRFESRGRIGLPAVSATPPP